MPNFFFSNQAAVAANTGFSATASPRNSMTIPLGRQSYLLSTGGSNNPIWVTRAKVRLAGNGASRTCSIHVGGSNTANFTVPAGTQAADVTFRAIDYKYSLTTAATISVGYNTSGSVFLGRWGTTAPGTDTIWGECDYTQVPTGPTNVTASSPSATTLRVSWNAPSDDGGSAIEGYYIQVSTSSTFSSIAVFDEVSASTFSRDFSGLTPGIIYYIRVFAYNTIYYNFSNFPMSRASATAQATVSAPPAPTWTTASTLPGVNVSTGYSLQLEASNTTSYTKLAGGTNDAWVSVSSSGLVTGTSPSTSQTATFTVRATGAGGSVDRTFTILVSGPAPVWSTTSPLPPTNTNVSYAVQVTASPVASYEKLSGGTNDSWVGVSSTGLVSGQTPATAQVSTFTIRASANGVSTDRQFSIDISVAPPAWTTGTSLPAGQQNVAYSTSISASNTSSYSKVSGDAWVSVSSSGAISGTPPSSGTTSFTARATGPTGLTTDRTFTISVAAAPVPVWVTASPLPSVVVNNAYNATVSATNAVSYSKLPGGTNDAWATVLSTGQITGVPNIVGEAVIKIRATSSLNMTSDKDFQVTVNAPPPVWVTSANLIGGKKGVAYSATVNATNANNYTISGSAPTWLSLNSTTGQITGTPDDDGDFTVTIIPSGLGGPGPSRTFFITIASASPEWIDSQLQDDAAILNVPYSDGFSASNVVASNGYIITGLPNGLTYNSTTGAISGTPTQHGVFTVSASALGQDGTTINTTDILTVFYPGKRFDTGGVPREISNIRRFNGTTWTEVQFVRRFDGTNWIEASN